MSDALPPWRVADFDQAYATVNARLDDVINAFRTESAETTEPREAQIAGLSYWLKQTFEPLGDGTNDLAELLTAAVVRLAAQDGKQAEGGR